MSLVQVRFAGRSSDPVTARPMIRLYLAYLVSG
jgi:hypothetical protein